MGNEQVLARHSVEEIKEKKWRRKRGKAWLRCSGAEKLRSECAVSFGEYARLEETDRCLFGEALKTIEKDVPRTMAASFTEPTWRELLREREIERGGESIREEMSRVCVAFVRREGRGDHRACRGYTQGMTFVVAILLLFVDEPSDAFWLLAALVERVAPRDLYSEPPAALAGTAAEAGVVRALLARLPASRREDDEERARTAEMLAVKMAVPLLVDCASAPVAVAVWDTVFVDKTFDLVACAVAATIEVVARRRATEQRPRLHRQPLLCAVLQHLSKLVPPLATCEDVEEAAASLASADAAAIRAETRSAIAKSWQERLSDLSNLGFTLAQLEELRDEFRLLAKGDHRLNRSQLLDLLASAKVPLSSTATDRVLDVVDVDADGSFDFKECVCCLSSLSAGTVRERLSFMFAIYDADNSGFLEIREVVDLARVLPTADLETRLRALDLDGDGKISREEWLLAATSSPDLLDALGVEDPPEREPVFSPLRALDRRASADSFFRDDDDHPASSSSSRTDHPAAAANSTTAVETIRRVRSVDISRPDDPPAAAAAAAAPFFFQQTTIKSPRPKTLRRQQNFRRSLFKRCDAIFKRCCSKTTTSFRPSSDESRAPSSSEDDRSSLFRADEPRLTARVLAYDVSH
ncbi:hypothetical protein CTAYLR_008020 [Chrysophaeum taylorii]|uniref:Calmodulin n=1 Tax=Chrysophaeum taylorii TaxID=2483200 RepID=A0AAD7XKJ1_9STRA|nr:hypothetical protein CTAYLR_008020 [Chrysophaeum taylorii]